MGNDGGSIPKRGDLVKLKSKVDLVDKESLNHEKWTLCALSSEPLSPPIVSCRLGKLYNKESILNFLLDRDRFSEVADAFGHITCLKDVTELQVKRAGDRFVCPLTGKEMNGSVRFFYYRSCVCVMAEPALTVADASRCTLCSKPLTEDDKIPLNGTAQEVEALRARLLTDKKRKKTKRKVEVDNVERIPLSKVQGEILSLKRTKNINELYK